MKKLLAIGLSVLLIAILSGCGSGEQGAPAGGGAGVNDAKKAKGAVQSRSGVNQVPD